MLILTWSEEEAVLSIALPDDIAARALAKENFGVGDDP
jgi:hypothetical protein